MPVTINGSGPIAGVTSINTTVTDTELGYLDGVSSSIQTQVDSKVSAANPTVTSPTAAGSNGVRNITISTSNPTGGNDGDVWLVYT